MKALFIAAVLITSSYAHAQTNFTGNWILKEKHSVSGPDYANAVSTKMNVQQIKDSLIIENISTDANNNETKARWSIPMNGETVTTKSAATGRRIDRSLAWSTDKKTLTITTPIYKDGSNNEIELTRIDKWSLSPDDKQLNINRRSIETVSENWEVNAVYTN